MYPTSTGGKYIAVLSMMMGVLVIAFPVSVFSELRAEELTGAKGFEHVSKNTSAKNNNLLEKEEYPVDLDDDDDIIVLSRDEMKELYECLNVIQDKEQRIRSILHQNAEH